MKASSNRCKFGLVATHVFENCVLTDSYVFLHVSLQLFSYFHLKGSLHDSWRTSSTSCTMAVSSTCTVGLPQTFPNLHHWNNYLLHTVLQLQACNKLSSQALCWYVHTLKYMKNDALLTKRSRDVASWKKVNWAIPKHKEPTEQAQLDKWN